MGVGRETAAMTTGDGEQSGGDGRAAAVADGAGVARGDGGGKIERSTT